MWRFGWLSTQVTDPAVDWDAKGLTWQAFESMRPALAGGLSSRASESAGGFPNLLPNVIADFARCLNAAVVAGESGPLHMRDVFGLV